MEVIRVWFRRHLSDPQVIGLAVVLLTGFAIIYIAGHMLAPMLASVIIAYLLEGLVAYLVRIGFPRFIAVLIVFSGFMAFVVFIIFGLMPLLSRQATQLAQQLPVMIARGQDLLMTLPERYPQLFSVEQVRDLIAAIRAETVALGQQAVSLSLASVVGVITWVVYLFLVPLMVFFFMKDKQRIVGWITGFLPRDRKLLAEVWRDVDDQIGNYVRGKFVEIIIVWIVTYVTFAVLGLQFSLLLGVVVGLSVLIPYVGAIAVTIPVALVAYFQWGFTVDFAWVLAAYGIIQALDGNVLVPLLFSEAVNLHPVAIIVAILIFGGLWGFWGIFFAIPLATLVQAVLKAWPKTEQIKPPDAPVAAD
ncbi:MAG: AI-2E family transporter [Gammaproteobacteria bacterium]|nr:AI-2E family transporter [Gammaproteobacteria bacterium]MDH3411424.1 AI-2E family transporter [Gammaproteobacteria bacterium]